MGGSFPGLFHGGLTESLSPGVSSNQMVHISGGGGHPNYPHPWPREVAFLNRAWDDVLALDFCLDTSRQVQPLLDHGVNTRPSRCVGFEGLGTGLERMRELLK